MDDPPGKIPRVFRQIQMKTEEEVINYILNPHSKLYCQQNVTNLQMELSRLIEGGNGAIDLRSVKDNLERIRAFKGRWLDQLKTVLDKELILTREWIYLLSKNEAVTDLLRKRGNEYFVKRQFDMALRAYTVAAMFAPNDSKSLALAYSNRSACFAETKNWNKCLEDIKRFEEIWNRLEEGFTLTGDKVAKRKEKCLEEIGDAEEKISIEKRFGNDFFKLKNPSAILPSAEDCLGVKTDSKKGRGIYNISDKVIEPGTLLILDEAYSHVCNDSFNFQTNNCSACNRILDGSGIPCGGCVFNLYCSEACATSDHHNIHAKYECKMAPYLFEIIPKTEFYTNTHLALSILLKLNPQALLDHYRQVFNGESQATDKYGNAIASYLPIYNLVYYDEILSEDELLGYSKFAVVLTETLDFCTDYFTCLNLDELELILLKEEFARRLLLHQMCINANGISTKYLVLPKQQHSTEESRPIKGFNLGFGLYPITSLINHSCAPNANWLSIPGGVLAVFALEHIVPGQELLVNYRGHYSTDVRESRRQDLWRHFGFKCECIACTENWPLKDNLKSAFKQLSSPFICPDCRMKFEVFDKIHLKIGPSKQLFVCPRKCGYKIDRDELQMTFLSHLKLGASAVELREENKILKSFMDAKKCVRYFDSHLSKPSKETQTMDGIMQHPLQIIAGKMFE